MNASATQNRKYEIVVGLDFSELSRRALEEALDLAQRHAPAALHVIAVAEPQGMLVRLPSDEAVLKEDAARERTRQHVADIVDAYQAQRAPEGGLGLERVAVYVVTGEPANLITDLARAVEADLVVVGTHGRHGVERLLLGSVAANVVRDAPCSVCVVRPADFVGGRQVPTIQPPLQPGEPHLRHFEHRRTYHYVDRMAPVSTRTMPAS